MNAEYYIIQSIVNQKLCYTNNPLRSLPLTGLNSLYCHISVPVPSHALYFQSHVSWFIFCVQWVNLVQRFQRRRLNAIFYQNHSCNSLFDILFFTYITIHTFSIILNLSCLSLNFTILKIILFKIPYGKLNPRSKYR
jgi:hypothetical protein